MIVLYPFDWMSVSCYMCRVEHFKYTSFIEFQYVLWHINTSLLNICDFSLASFISPRKQQTPGMIF